MLLAIDTFRRFFPSAVPFAGSNMRAHAASDVMGTVITAWFDSLQTTDEDYAAMAADEWVAVDRINAGTESNFTGWPEFIRSGGDKEVDNFTTTVGAALHLPLKLSSSIFRTARVAMMMKGWT